MTARILIVDDEVGMLEVCRDSLEPLDAEMVVESQSTVAAQRLHDESFDLLVTDLRMPGKSGMDLLKLGRERDPRLPVVVVTAFPEVDSAIAAMKEGGVDYLTKPFHPDDLLATVERLLQSRRLQEENELLQRQLGRSKGAEGLVGESTAMQALGDAIARVAQSDVDVLITGETGTGKELAARAIHQHSRRAAHRFVPVNAGAIPEHLLESELFGYERGAFTGAHARTIGLLEYASGGTLFLDEIAELPVQLQAKLLRALQERRIRRVGGRDEIPIDVRILAATARNLEAMIDEGSFREDLYYRINVVHLRLPPLRERGGDVPLLVAHFLQRHGAQRQPPLREVDDEALDVLRRYGWPGNVRELENVIRHAVAMAHGPHLQAADLPERVRAGVIAGADAPAVGSTAFFRARDDFERRYLSELLQRHEGNVAAATREADLPRGTFYRLLSKHGLKAKEFRD